MNIKSDIGQSFRKETVPLGYWRMDYTDWYTWTEKYRAFLTKFIGPNGGRRHIKYHIGALPPKVCRFSGEECEKYVWEDREHGWRVYVSSMKGIQFEFFRDANPKVAWDHYRLQFEKYFFYLSQVAEVRKIMAA